MAHDASNMAAAIRSMTCIAQMRSVIVRNQVAKEFAAAQRWRRLIRTFKVRIS
jgi:hypothetical protein